MVDLARIQYWQKHFKHVSVICQIKRKIMQTFYRTYTVPFYKLLLVVFFNPTNNKPFNNKTFVINSHMRNEDKKDVFVNNVDMSLVNNLMYTRRTPNF